MKKGLRPFPGHREFEQVFYLNQRPDEEGIKTVAEEAFLGPLLI